MEKLRKILSIVFIVLMFLFIGLSIVSYTSPVSNTAKLKEDIQTGEIIYEVRGINFHVVEIDGHEYLLGTESYGHGGVGFFSHKADCKRCKEERY